MPENFKKFCERFTAADIAGNDPIIFCKSTDLIPDVVKTLTTNGILSAPVWNEQEKQFMGFIDVIDLVVLIATAVAAKDLIPLFSDREVSMEEFLVQVKETFAEQTIAELIDCSTRNPWTAIPSNTPWHSLLELLGKDGANLHRVAVTDGETTDAGHVKHVITQSKVIEFLATETPKFATKALKEKIGDHFLCKGPVITISKNATVIQGFQKIAQKLVSAIAVVDENDRIYGILSASDLKCSYPDSIFSDLSITIEQFMEKTNKFFSRNSKLPRGPIYATPATTVEACLQYLHGWHIHRAFIIDDDRKPVGVVSLCDMISFFNKYDYSK